MPAATVEAVRAALHALWIAVPGTRLREEDEKKAVEVAAVLALLGPGRDGRVLVDAAAGKGYVGVLAAKLAGWRDVVVLERDPGRADVVRALAGAVGGDARIEVRTGDVSDKTLWPEAPAMVVGLHACGAASDAILDGAVAARARHVLVVPCCYGRSIPFAPVAEARADALGIPRHAEVRRAFVRTMIDAERTLRLEAAGYETTVMAFVPPTVTPHHLAWRARRLGEPHRMQEAAERLARLRDDR